MVALLLVLGWQRAHLLCPGLFCKVQLMVSLPIEHCHYKVDSLFLGTATEIFSEDEVVIFSFFSLIHRVDYAARFPDMSY